MAQEENYKPNEQRPSPIENTSTESIPGLLYARNRDSQDSTRCHEEDKETCPDILEFASQQFSTRSIPECVKIITKSSKERDIFISNYIVEKKEKLTSKKEYTLFCGTWNVNGQSPPETLAEWLTEEDNSPDIYVIGFQELDLGIWTLVSNFSAKEEQWHNAVRNSLPKNVSYKELKQIRMVGIMLLVYVKDSLVPQLIDADYAATGIMRILGNKGGVGVRMNLHNTSICFVNTHLAAHQDQLERRNQDYRDVNRKMKFNVISPPLSISEHDMIFWIGDLNYRIHVLDMDKVKSMIAKKKLLDLLSYDQLHRQLSRPNVDVFKGYKEGRIMFEPTYKYNIGSGNWDSSGKNRTPAWCDRILFKGEEIESVRYASHPDISFSDHKPVSSFFKIKVKVIDEEKLKKMRRDVLRKLDSLENDYLPQVKLDKTEVKFNLNSISLQ